MTPIATSRPGGRHNRPHVDGQGVVPGRPASLSGSPCCRPYATEITQRSPELRTSGRIAAFWASSPEAAMWSGGWNRVIWTNWRARAVLMTGDRECDGRAEHPAGQHRCAAAAVHDPCRQSTCNLLWPKSTAVPPKQGPTPNDCSTSVHLVRVALHLHHRLSRGLPLSPASTGKRVKHGNDTTLHEPVIRAPAAYPVDYAGRRLRQPACFPDVLCWTRRRDRSGEVASSATRRSAIDLDRPGRYWQNPPRHRNCSGERRAFPRWSAVCVACFDPGSFNGHEDCRRCARSS
jgi:hypothetical protein